MTTDIQKIANQLRYLRKTAVALPVPYQALLGLGVGGATGGLAYWLSGKSELLKKQKLARIIGSTLLGLGAGAGAVGIGNSIASRAVVNKLTKKEEAELNADIASALSRRDGLSATAAMAAKQSLLSMSHEDKEKLLDASISEVMKGEAYGRALDDVKIGGLVPGKGFFKSY